MNEAKPKTPHDGLPPLLSLETLAGGAAGEMLARELVRMAEDISDPNTKATAKRKIKFEMDVMPFPDRSGASYEVTVTSKLAGMKPAPGSMFIVKRGGQLLVVGKNDRQLEMELELNAPAPESVARPS